MTDLLLGTLPQSFLLQCASAARALEPEELANLQLEPSLLQALSGVAPTTLSSPEELALGYEQILLAKGEQRRTLGAVYTPVALIDEILSEALALTTPVANLRLLDPACGSGLFLLRALRLLHQQDPSLSASAQLFGIDLDPLAICVSRLALALLRRQLEIPVNGSTVTRQLRLGNFLMPPEHALRFEYSGPACPEYACSSGSFHYIVGNPPYGLKRGEKLSPPEMQALLLTSSGLSGTKPNKYLAFMQRSYQLLRPRGAMAFVVPNSWLGIDSGFNLRRNFVEQRCLRRLTHYQENPFPTQGVEVVSFWLVKPAPATTAPTEIEVRLRQEAAGALLNSHCISYQQIAASPNMGIPLQQSVLRNSASKLPETTLCLGDARSGFDARIALQAYALGKGSPPQTAAVVREHSFHCESAEDASCVPYLEGKDIAPFNCSWSGEYLRHGPWLAEAQPLGRFTGPRLVLREVLPARGAMLCATYLEQPYLYNKSVLHILPSALSRQDSLFALSQPGPQQSSTVLLKALLSVLTSSFGSEWFYSFGRKAQRRLFPKLVLADLRDFPLPKAFYQEAPALAQLADQQLEYCIESQGNLCATIRARCNQLVAELYQLSGQQRKGLEQQSGTPLTSHSA